MTTSYDTQSRFTDPGPWRSRLDPLPRDITALQRAASELVFHYRAGGDYAANGVAPERMSEIDSRYAEPMFGRLFELDDAELGRQRRSADRLVGCCRDSTVFFLAMARDKGIPARARVGFATYFDNGWNGDHVVAEAWDENERRWRLVDPGIGPDHVDPSDGRRLDSCDIPADRFIIAPRAWLDCRRGAADPETFGVAPDLELSMTRSWPYLAHNLVHDLAALNKYEMVLWDVWGIMDSGDSPTADQAAALDRLAALTVDPADAEVRTAFQDADFRVPAEVTSYSPARQESLRVPIPM